MSELVALAAGRPPVRVNQVGYVTDGPKAATVITDAAAPLAYAVGSRTGHTVPAGRDSGFGVHTLDFSGLREPGTYRIEVEGLAPSHPFVIAADPYAGLLRDARLVLHAQRSGIAIDDAVLPGYGRPAGHVGVPPNRGDTAVGAVTGVYPGWRFDGVVDVSGGWYDAGDHGKYVAGGGFAAALVLAAHELTGDPALLDEALWQVDWLVRMQVPPGHQHAGLAFHRVHDAYWTPLPMAPHDDPAPRVLHRPSTTAGLTLAAVAAQAARLTGRSDLLAVARTAYEAALREPDLLAPDDQGAHGGGPYDDPDPSDDLAWAAAELWLATGDETYRPAAPPAAADFDWDDLPLWTAIRLGDAATVTAAADGLLGLEQPWGQPYAPTGGWHWGSTGRILHNLAVLGTAHRLTGAPAYRSGMLSGLDYLFGRNPVGLSYVTGWGTETASHQRVRHFTTPPRGAIAGGPCSRPTPGFATDPRFEGLPDQLHYVDEPTSETTNDICIRWNAALVLVAALLVQAPQLDGAVAGGGDGGQERGADAVDLELADRVDRGAGG